MHKDRILLQNTVVHPLQTVKLSGCGMADIQTEGRIRTPPAGEPDAHDTGRMQSAGQTTDGSVPAEQKRRRNRSIPPPFIEKPDSAMPQAQNACMQ